jgi:hypothetical protein
MYHAWWRLEGHTGFYFENLKGKDVLPDGMIIFVEK